MTSWNDGYITELTYTAGFYEELIPAHLLFSALLAGYDAPSSKGKLAYCELGCGQGVTSAVIAASDPRFQVYANDFNPSHIAAARTMAAGVDNIYFSDASFRDFAADPNLPEFDIIALHGIYSWISPENRRFIVDFISKKLKVGGLVYISYNAQPGWAPKAQIGELMRLHGRQHGGSALSRLSGARDFVDRLAAVDTGYFRANPIVGGWFEEIKKKDERYLAHEFMSDNWNMFSSAEVADEMSAAKLTFATSLNVLDQLPQFALKPDQYKLLSEIKDPILREVTRDFIVNQQFRRDLFIKGSVRLSKGDLDERWAEQTFVSLRAFAETDFKFTAPLGEVNLRPEVYRPILQALEAGPRSVRQLMTDPEISKQSPQQLRDALATLVAFRRIQAALNADGLEARTESTDRFNASFLKRALVSEDNVFLASPFTGGAVAVARLDQLFILSGAADREGAVQFAWRTLRAQEQSMVIDGKKLETEEQNLDALRSRYDGGESRRLLFSRLGVLPGGQA